MPESPRLIAPGKKAEHATSIEEPPRNSAREEVLRPLAEAVRQGTYHRDAFKVAEKVVQSHMISPL